MKLLPKKTEATVKEDLTIQCTVNDFNAPVKWYKGDDEITGNELPLKYVIDKSMLGHCKLTIKKATKADSATYKCRIVGTKQVTKGTVTFKGSRFETRAMSN